MGVGVQRMVTEGGEVVTVIRNQRQEKGNEGEMAWRQGRKA